jgi:hypothetical protein
MKSPAAARRHGVIQPPRNERLPTGNCLHCVPSTTKEDAGK